MLGLWKKANHWLEGKPDSFLTVLLLIIAVFTVLIAFIAPPALKAIVAAYFVFP